MTTLIDILDAAPPDAVAADYAGAPVTFAALADESARLAAGLAGLGVGPADRVALWLPNVPAWLTAFFACARLGAIAVSVNTRFRAHEIGDILSRSQARVLFMWPDFHAIDFTAILAEVDPGALAALGHVVVYGEAGAAAPDAIQGVPATSFAAWRALAPYRQVDGRDDDRCVIFTTSGTTSAPKFVCHDQRTVAAHARDVVAALALDRPDCRVLQALPLCGVFGFTQALAALAARAPMAMLPVFDPEQAARAIERLAVTHAHGVDDMLAALLAARGAARPYPSLRHFGYAAFNPALDDIVTAADARGLSAVGLYGMSECQALFALQSAAAPAAERRKGGGRPVSPAARVRVRDAASGELLGPGERGEIELAGPSVMREYFGDPAATAAAFTADGFLRTGDLGYLEPDGRFCYVARAGDALRLGGFLTSPREIEAVIDSHPAVAASQVVGAEVDGRQRAVAFVIAAGDDGVAEETIIAHCRAQLAGYKVPARVFTLDAFPTTASANGTKIRRAELRAWAEERTAGTHREA